MLENGTKVFGEWVVDKKIGSGSYGTVYKIKRVEFGTEYYAALKVINIPQDSQDHMRLRTEGMDNESINTYYGQIAQNFIQEIKLLSSMDGNTNIVDYKDHSVIQNGEFGYTIYIRMQLLTPLNDRLVDENGNAVFLPVKEVLKLGVDMCSALEVCEKKRVVHRDIKIDNIFASETGDYKLGDFGIAKQLESTQGEMSKKGTMMYMAPEVFRGEKYNNTADIYSLGIVLYRLLNKNRAPFFPMHPAVIKFSDKEEANMKRLNGEVFPEIPELSGAVMTVLRRATAFNPSDRYKTAAEFKRELQKIIDSGCFTGKTPGSAQQTAAKLPATDNKNKNSITDKSAKKDNAALKETKKTTEKSGSKPKSKSKKPLFIILALLIVAGIVGSLLLCVFLGFIGSSGSDSDTYYDDYAVGDDVIVNNNDALYSDETHTVYFSELSYMNYEDAGEILDEAGINYYYTYVYSESYLYGAVVDDIRFGWSTAGTASTGDSVELVVSCGSVDEAWNYYEPDDLVDIYYEEDNMYDVYLYSADGSYELVLERVLWDTAYDEYIQFADEIVNVADIEMLDGSARVNYGDGYLDIIREYGVYRWRYDYEILD